MKEDLLDALIEIDGRGEPTDGTKTYIHRGGRYLSGMPYEWTAFAERAFIFRDRRQAEGVILQFKELGGANIGQFKPDRERAK